MYVPPLFKDADPALALRLMREYPLANFVIGGAEPLVTPVPVLVDDGNAPWRLRFHLAARNPHCERLAQSGDGTLLFSGPNCYVSPSWYSDHPNVPTWNYVAVHVSGRAVAVSEEELAQILRDMTEHFEASVGGDWRYDDLPSDFKRKLLAEIRGYRFEVTRVEAKLKLSQNRPAHDREHVTQRLLASDNASAHAVGEWMRAKYGHDPR